MYNIYSVRYVYHLYTICTLKRSRIPYPLTGLPSRQSSTTTQPHPPLLSQPPTRAICSNTTAVRIYSKQQQQLVLPCAYHHTVHRLMVPHADILHIYLLMIYYTYLWIYSNATAVQAEQQADNDIQQYMSFESRIVVPFSLYNIMHCFLVLLYYII